MKTRKTDRWRWTPVLAAIVTISAGAAFVTQSAGDDAPAKRATSKLEVRVLEPDGQKTTKAYVNVWRAVEPRDPMAGSPYTWRERPSGRTWIRAANWWPRNHRNATSVTFENVEPGEYRVTAASFVSEAHDPTPFGSSDSFRIDGSRQNVTVTVLLRGGAPLTVRALDAKTGRPIRSAVIRLFREDGTPIVYGHGSGNFFERSDDSGEVRYARLVPGKYYLDVTGKRASTFDLARYEPLDPDADSLSVDVKADRENVALVLFERVPLTDEQIEERFPFGAFGTVTDERGRPLPGVEVRAHTGMGTLFQTGAAVTDEGGGYGVRFGPGFRSSGGVHSQVATISVHKPGYYERNLHRQGNWMMGRRRPEKIGDFQGVVLPNKPVRIDFEMILAASVVGRIVDQEGRPLANRRIWLDGETLPPSTGVLAAAETDSTGRFQFVDVPRKPYRWWFTVTAKKEPGQRFGTDVESGTIELDRPTIYRVQLRYRNRSAGGPSLDVESVEPQ